MLGHATGRRAGWLEAVGLGTQQARAWAMYDWANSAFATTITASVFPIYFVRVAGAGLPDGRAYATWTVLNGVALAVSAALGPLLGAVADRLGASRRFLLGFAALGIAASASLATVGRGEWRLGAVLFAIGLIGFSSANVFYDSLLSRVSTPEQADRLSAAGYAMGYLGGGLLLVLHVAMIQRPGWFGLAAAAAGEPLDGPATRWAFVTVALWWLVFTVPLWRHVGRGRDGARGVGPAAGRDDAGAAAGLVGGPNGGDEGRARGVGGGGDAPARPRFGAIVRDGTADLVRTLRAAPRHRDLFVFLVAFWLYSDGIGTFQKQAAAYGSEIGLGAGGIIGALVMTQFAGVPFSFGFGLLARRVGARRALFLGLAVFTVVAALARFVALSWHFYALAFGVAMVQGGTQALSRSLFSRLVPAGQEAAFFAFFSVSSKFAGVLGPLLIGLLGLWGVGARDSIFVLVVLFVAGMAVLSRVDFERGRRAAHAAA